MATGKVTIDASLNNSQVVRAGDGLKKTMDSIAASIKRAFHGKELQVLQQQLEQTRAAMVPVAQELAEIESRSAGAGKSAAADFAKAEAQAQKLGTEYDSLVAKITAYEAKVHEKFAAPVGTDPKMAANLQEAEFAALETDKAYQKMVADADALRNKQAALNASMGQMKQAADAAGGTGSAHYQELQSKMEGLTATSQELNQKIQSLGGGAQTVGATIAQSLGGKATAAFGALKQAAGSVAGVMKKALGAVASAAKGMAAKIQDATKGMRQFGSRLMSIASGALVFNLISAGLRNMTSYMGTALGQSTALSQALANLRGAAATAAAPLVQALAPALATLANAAATVFSYVAKLISLLTGKSLSSMQSTAKSMSGVGSAAGSTAKKVDKATRSLAAFDELNRLDAPNDSSDSGGGGSGAGVEEPDFNFDFEGKSPFLDSILAAIEEGDWYKVGSLVGEKLRDTLNAIPWPDIQAKAKAWATNLANTINGFIETPGLWQAIGHTMAQGLNTVTGFVDTFFQGVHWENLGVGLAQGLQTIVDEVEWEQLGRTLTDGLRAVFLTLHGFVTTFKGWAQLGDNVGKMIIAAFGNINWVQAAKDLSTLAVGILTAINHALSAISWGDVGKTILDMLIAIDWPGLLTQLGLLFVNLLPVILPALLITAAKNVLALVFAEISKNALAGVTTLITGKLLPAIGSGISKLFLTIGPKILTALSGLATSIFTAISGFITTVVATIGLWPAILLAAVAVIGVVLLAYVVTHWEKVKQAFTDGWNALCAFCDEFGAKVTEIWNNRWNQIYTDASALWETICTGWNDFWTNMQSAADSCGAQLSEAWNGWWNQLYADASALWETITTHWNDFWTNMQTAADSCGAQLSEAWNGWWNQVYSDASTLWDSITTHWNDFWSNMQSAANSCGAQLSEAWNQMWAALSNGASEALTGLKNVVKGGINGIIGFINGLIRGVISGVNQMISALNSIQVSVPSWVPEFGGKSFGFNLSTVSAPQIPYLAQGAVIPANREFLAVLGDQHNGTNVEAPLSTIQAAVKAAMLELEGQGGSEQPINIYIGEELLDSIIVNSTRRRALRSGGRA